MERPFFQVPRALLIGLLVALILQLSLRSLNPPSAPKAADLPPPPSANALAITAFGDPIPLAKVLMLYLQAFDNQSGSRTPYQALDYQQIETWLSRILQIDPIGQYPLMAASRLYAEVPDEAKKRQMLELVYREFFKDPDRRWPWLAHAAALAKHGLKDLPLARRYAAAIQTYSLGEEVPLWARQMEIFILEDMNELETARIMIGGYIEKGLVKHPGELRFLEQRLQELESRIKQNK